MAKICVEVDVASIFLESKDCKDCIALLKGGRIMRYKDFGEGAGQLNFAAIAERHRLSIEQLNDLVHPIFELIGYADDWEIKKQKTK